MTSGRQRAIQAHSRLLLTPRKRAHKTLCEAMRALHVDDLAKAHRLTLIALDALQDAKEVQRITLAALDEVRVTG